MSIALSRDSREDVDEVLAKGLAAGGTEPRRRQDYGFMYSRDLEDPDGNILAFLLHGPRRRRAWAPRPTWPSRAPASRLGLIACMATRAARGFGQYGGVARALERVGERWALLIVRDLLVGPRRYGDLKTGLPRIPTNILSDRLKELQEAGVVRRVPTVRGGYELTELGRALEPVDHRPRRWGWSALGEPAEGEIVTPTPLALALRAAFRADVAASHRRRSTCCTSAASRSRRSSSATRSTSCRSAPVPCRSRRGARRPRSLRRRARAAVEPAACATCSPARPGRSR